MYSRVMNNPSFWLEIGGLAEAERASFLSLESCVLILVSLQYFNFYTYCGINFCRRYR